MPKDREKKTLNPATAHLKSEKARALKKGKAAVSAQRTDRLASRNPFRLERQIADLKALAADGGLGARDKKQLEELERQLGMVRKAREKVGDNRVSHSAGREEGSSRGRDGAGRGREGYAGLGKRTRGDGRREGSSSDGTETDESVRAIPMPRDTPPPIPHAHPQRHDRGRGGAYIPRGPSTTGNANTVPLGSRPFPHHTSSTTSLPPPPHPSSTAPPSSTTAKTTYEAQPAIRDLRKEAVRAFVPAVVARKVMAAKGVGGRLLEEEEVGRLEGGGYVVGGGVGGGGERGGRGGGGGNGGVGEGKGLEEEEESFRREVEMEMVEEGEEGERGEGHGHGRKVGMEEVSDEDL